MPKLVPGISYNIFPQEQIHVFPRLCMYLTHNYRNTSAGNIYKLETFPNQTKLFIIKVKLVYMLKETFDSKVLRPKAYVTGWEAQYC